MVHYLAPLAQFQTFRKVRGAFVCVRVGRERAESGARGTGGGKPEQPMGAEH